MLLENNLDDTFMNRYRTKFNHFFHKKVSALQ